MYPHISLQIDDKEFDIPQVDTPPTLESILNEVTPQYQTQTSTLKVLREMHQTYLDTVWHQYFLFPLQPEEEEEPFILEDTCLLNTENIDAHSCETSSLASSDSGDRTHLKR